MKNIKKAGFFKILSIILISILALSFVGCSSESSPIDEDSKEAENQKTREEESDSRMIAPGFTLENLEGEMVSLEDYRGKKVTLYLWTTSCRYCIEGFPHIERFYQKYKDEGYTILAINLGENKDKVKEFINENNYTVPVLLDIEGSVPVDYPITGIPANFFIDEEGYALGRQPGMLTFEMMDANLPMLFEN